MKTVPFQGRGMLADIIEPADVREFSTDADRHGISPGKSVAQHIAGNDEAAYGLLE
jgi:hypothetical protein